MQQTKTEPKWGVIFNNQCFRGGIFCAIDRTRGEVYCAKIVTLALDGPERFIRLAPIMRRRNRGAWRLFRKQGEVASLQVAHDPFSNDPAAIESELEIKELPGGRCAVEMPATGLSFVFHPRRKRRRFKNVFGGAI